MRVGPHDGIEPKRPIAPGPQIEIIPGRLYFMSSAAPPTSNDDAFFFSIDEELQYDPFNNDFGPLSLA